MSHLELSLSGHNPFLWLNMLVYGWLLLTYNLGMSRYVIHGNKMLNVTVVKNIYFGPVGSHADHKSIAFRILTWRECKIIFPPA